MKGSRLIPARFLGALLFCAMLTSPVAADAASKADEMAAREHINKGNYHLGQRQFQQALDEYQEALRIDPTSSVAKDNVVLVHNNWGIHHFQQRKYEEAEKEWRQALSLDSTNHLAKHNIQVLKATLARQGKQLPSEAAAANPQKSPAKKEGPSSSVTILTPGFKQTGGGGASFSSSESGGETPSESTTTTGGSTPTPPPETPPAETGFDTPPTSAPSQSTGSSFEDQLTGIEVKIYGRRQPDMSVIKRLEKIETDTTGQCGTGTIKERIDKLRRSYGL
jgi:tetratricopeptide (TPR) repeat protein